MRYKTIPLSNELIAEHAKTANNSAGRDMVIAKIKAALRDREALGEELLSKGDKMLASEARDFDANFAEFEALSKWASAPVRTGDGPCPPAVTQADFSDVKSVGLGAAMFAAGFDVFRRPSVETKASAALIGAETKAWTLPGPTDVRGPATLVPMGHDERWLWPFLVKEPTPSEQLAVSDYRQTARTLTGTVQRSATATTDKASLDGTVSLVVEAIPQHAVVIPQIPVALFAKVRQMEAFLRSEGEFVINTDIDTHVFSQIVAASPPFGMTGTTLVDKVRNGVSTMRGTGANPTLLVVNPSDAASLDLTSDAGGYVFAPTSLGTSSPLWGLRVIERAGAGNEPPYLIDPEMLGVLYLGNVHYDADPYSGFRKNLVDLRVEVDALYHVRNANGARRIAAT